MKKSLSLILTFVIIFKVIGVSAFAAEGKEIQVQIPCQYTVWYDIKEGNINGYLIDGNVYVTSSTIGMLTGYNAYPDDSFITFMKDDRTSSFFYRLDLANGKLIRHAIVTQTEWDIDIKKLSNGSYAMNLEEMLLAMNVQIAFSDDEEYLLCTYLPYSVYDAWLAFQKSNSSLFSWVEIEEDQGDIDPQQVGILSAINSLYIDYNDHFVTDAFIAWWTDDVLTATEEQYMDAMTEILLYMAEDHNSFLSDDDLYKTYKHDNKAVGLAVKLLKLLDVDEEISDITKILGTGSSFVGKGITVLDLVNTLYQYRSISETQRDVLKELFVNFPMYAQATDSASRHIYNAANKLNQRIEEGAVGTTATICDAVVDLFIGELEGTITEVTPVLAIVKAVATIIKITPGLSDLADTNKHINLGCDTWVLLMLSIYNYNCWADNFYSYSFPTEDGMTQLKLTMLFRIMASITARQHFIKTDTLQESTVTAMNSKNQDLTKLYFLIESSKPITAPINNSPTINWDNYVDEIQSDFDNRDLADNDIFSTYLEAAGKTTATGSWTEEMNMTASMILKNGSSSTKTKATMEASVDIEGWNGTDTSALYMSGSASMSVLNQTIAYTMTWQNGTAHYEYTEPTGTSADLKIDPSYFNFNSLTDDMIISSAMNGNQITFSIQGDALTKAGISAVNSLLSGVENLSYEDATVNVTVNEQSGKIDTLTMTFRASMTYQGYDAEADYEIQYEFSEHEGAEKSEDVTNSNQDLSDLQARFFVKDVDSGLNLRSLPQHDSNLEGTIYDDTIMYFYGEIGQGLGSDGVMHEWYKVMADQELIGWVRSDLIKEIFIESEPEKPTSYLEDLSYDAWDRYTGNEGDSFIEKVGTRNSSTDINGVEYSHGLECWVARWNYKNETSWVWKEWALNKSYSTMQGEITISDDCYNKNNYMTNIEFVGDGGILCSYTLTPGTNYPIAFSSDISQVETLRISVEDDGSFSGGTSFILGNITLT